jgi:hypothetical protein
VISGYGEVVSLESLRNLKPFGIATFVFGILTTVDEITAEDGAIGVRGIDLLDS